MGLVHRDVKPANVLIVEGAGADDSNHVYLSDFGIAKQQASNVTRTGMFIGTAEYASPEQIEGKDLDGRSDVYSLGCVLYQCLTGNPAYEKDSEVALIYAHLLEAPPSTRAARPDLAAGDRRRDRQGDGEESGRPLRDREGSRRGGPAGAVGARRRADRARRKWPRRRRRGSGAADVAAAPRRRRAAAPPVAAAEPARRSRRARTRPAQDRRRHRPPARRGPRSRKRIGIAAAVVALGIVGRRRSPWSRSAAVATEDAAPTTQTTTTRGTTGPGGAGQPARRAHADRHRGAVQDAADRELRRRRDRALPPARQCSDVLPADVLVLVLPQPCRTPPLLRRP